MLSKKVKNLNIISSDIVDDWLIKKILGGPVSPNASYIEIIETLSTSPKRFREALITLDNRLKSAQHKVIKECKLPPYIYQVLNFRSYKGGLDSTELRMLLAPADRLELYRYIEKQREFIEFHLKNIAIAETSKELKNKLSELRKKLKKKST